MKGRGGKEAVYKGATLWHPGTIRYMCDHHFSTYKIICSEALHNVEAIKNLDVWQKADSIFIKEKYLIRSLYSTAGKLKESSGNETQKPFK